MDSPAPTRKRHRWTNRVGVLLVVGWAGFLTWVLLVSDPPDFWLGDIGRVQELGHLLAGIGTGFLLFVILSARTKARPWRVALASLTLAIVFLLVLEGLQALLADRGAERSDVTNSINGSIFGVGTAWIVVSLARWRRASFAEDNRSS